MLLSMLIAIALAGGQPVSASTSPEVRVDAETLRKGIETRLGPEAAGWAVEVRSSPDPSPHGVRLELRPPTGEPVITEVDVLGTDPAARAVELAATVALAIEDARAGEAAADAGDTRPDAVSRSVATPAPDGVRGWLGLDGVVALNPAVRADPAGGAGLRGGLWLLSGHLQPVLGVTWESGAVSELRAHAGTVEACLLAGDGVGQSWWIGGGGCAGARRALAMDRGRAARWGAAFRLPVRAQARVHPRVVLGAEVALNVSAPALRFVGADDEIRWRRLRLMAGLGVALALGDVSRSGS